MPWNLLMDFMVITEDAEPVQELDIHMMLQTVDYINACENGMVVTVFLDGAEIEYHINSK